MMGREIRRVPADWEHPRKTNNLRPSGHAPYQPMHDCVFEDRAREWLDKAIAWDNGTDPDCAEHKITHPFYWQWDGPPPNAEDYRPRWTSEPTHYQVYETVTEGTPVTPHFATKAELIDWLVEHGDEWDQMRTAEGQQESSGWSRENAVAFVEREWAPSMVLVAGKILTPRDGGF